MARHSGRAREVEYAALAGGEKDLKTAWLRARLSRRRVLSITYGAPTAAEWSDIRRGFDNLFKS